MEEVAGEDGLFNIFNDRLNRLISIDGRNGIEKFENELLGRIGTISGTHPHAYSDPKLAKVDKLIDKGYEKLNDVIREVHEYEKKVLNCVC